MTATAAITHSSVPLATSLALLARLASYPEPDFDAIMARAIVTVGGAMLTDFRATMLALNHDAREELYTATFDVTPQCVPYVSIHLFGEENFKRGEFMAELHSQYEQTEFDTRGELPDHIAILLRYAATLGESERRELVEFCLLGPLGKMIRMLPPGQPYRFLLESVDEVLHAAYPGLQPALSPLEQMRQHGGACPAVADGCGCGAVDDGARTSARIIGGPDDPGRTEVRAPVPTTLHPTLHPAC